MIYDVRLRLGYRYASPAAAGRHLARVMPLTRPGEQRVIAASLAFAPQPGERSEQTDFFGNQATAVTFRTAHETLDIRMSARVVVERVRPELARTLPLGELVPALTAIRTLAPDSPHHFLSTSPLVALEQEIAAYARNAIDCAATVGDAAMRLCLAIDRDFAYDSRATDVRTPPAEAFRLRRGVCQDFSHIMIAGLRGLGIPAGYVSGFLRTIPPPGKERLEGADAMHAWVRVWCGPQSGWVEFDPTNSMLAGNDHIVVGCGRDYSDVAPIIGVLRAFGGQEARQSVDVVPVV